MSWLCQTMALLLFVPIEFDVQLQRTNRNLKVVIAPQVRNGSYNGCIVIEMHRKDKAAIIQTLKHDAKCSKNMTLEKKYGTRPMLLGALHCAKEFAAQYMPHVNKFMLADESSYNCPPLSSNVKTIATDVLLLKETYYARHLNMKPTSQLIKDTIAEARERLNNAFDMNFSEFWERIHGQGRATDYLRSSQTNEQKQWLDKNKQDIRDIYLDSKKNEFTWHQLFDRMYTKYGCTFFASCALRLIDIFELNALIGAAWMVRFRNLPTIVNGSEIKVSVNEMNGGGGARRIEKLLARRYARRHL